MKSHSKCIENGCDLPAVVAIFDENARDLAPVYCNKHAIEAGYCVTCGEFSAGTHAFDLEHPGQCQSCFDMNNYDIDYSVMDDLPF